MALDTDCLTPDNLHDCSPAFLANRSEAGQGLPELLAGLVRDRVRPVAESCIGRDALGDKWFVVHGLFLTIASKSSVYDSSTTGVISLMLCLSLSKRST